MHSLVVIDDEYLVVEGIKAMVDRRKMNYKVVGCAYDGISGLDTIRDKQPDLVITDIRIPGLDGLSLIEAAKEFCPKTLFVVISGYAEFEYARRALCLGVKGYIDKPISIQALQTTLDRLEPEVAPDAEKEQAHKEILQEYEKIEAALENSIQSILQADPTSLHENTEKGFQWIFKIYPEPQDSKREIYKFLCVLSDILLEQSGQVKKDASVSFQKIEELQTRQEILDYAREIISGIARFMEASQTGSNHRTVLQLLDYIDEHYNQNIGLNELADMVQMNPAYLSVLFKKEVGKSYVKYLTDLRMRHAEEFLLQGKKVSDVSCMVGYSNYRYFCDVFKKHRSMTPYEYKNGSKKKA